MTENQHVKDWVTFFKASPPGYKASALRAAYKNDGEKMLSLVLKELKIYTAVDLVKQLD